MTNKILSQGAEAVIYQKENLVIKNRITKAYRLKELDNKIRKLRTRSEAKLLTKASELINAPKVKETLENEAVIEMEFISGDKLSETLSTYPEKKQFETISKIGQAISKIHSKGIIHGDLTTSNMILKDKEVFLIDFGLGYQNGKYEDKAVDLHVFKQALEAKHFENWKNLFEKFEKAYLQLEPKEAQKVLERLKAVEKRGRYKH